MQSCLWTAQGEMLCPQQNQAPVEHFVQEPFYAIKKPCNEQYPDEYHAKGIKSKFMDGKCTTDSKTKKTTCERIQNPAYKSCRDLENKGE